MTPEEELEAAIEVLRDWHEDAQGAQTIALIDAQIELLEAILEAHALIPLPVDDYEVWPIPAYAQKLAKAILMPQVWLDPTGKPVDA